MFLLQADLVDHALKISPYNAMAYGLLVGLLIYAQIWTTKQWMKDRRFMDEYSKESIKLTTMIIASMDQEKITNLNLSKEIQESTKANTAILTDIRMELYKLRTERENK